MRIKDLLRSAGLSQSDGELLMAFAVGQERPWVLAHENDVLPENAMQRWNDACAKRKNGMPIAYIVGAQEFYGRTFVVTPEVLIPRPSTEALIDGALRMLRGDAIVDLDADTGICIIGRRKTLHHSDAMVVDVGTGSGIIAVTLACEEPRLRCVGIDISGPALKIATQNAQRHHVENRTTWKKGLLLEPMADVDRPFFVVSNPPYIPDGTALPADVFNFEPHSALFAGDDGLSIIRPLLASALRHPSCLGFILECRTDQRPAIESIIEENSATMRS